MDMNYNVNLEDFQGPMDLLLDLIKKNNLDIYNINLSLITDQYLNHIKEMEKIDLSISSDYLVIAAELIGIKSKKLLPNYQTEEEESFISRVIEYKCYKDICEQFKELSCKRNACFSKKPSDISKYKENIKIDEQISEAELMDALYRFLERKEAEKPLEGRVAKKDYSISQRIAEISKILEKNGKISFFELFEESSRSFIIITFLAILEMSNKLMIELTQKNNYEQIYLVRRGHLHD